MRNLLKLGLAALVAACGGGGSGGPDAAPGIDASPCGGDPVTLTITEPVEGATVSPDRPQAVATLSRCLNAPREATAVLEGGGAVVTGGLAYSSTNLDLLFTPFALLESDTEYTLTIATEGGGEDSVTFRTAVGYEGAVPPLSLTSFFFEIDEFDYPPELVSLFQTIRPLLPENVIHVAEMEVTGEGEQTATLTLVGGAAERSTAPPNLTLIPEDPETPSYSTTAMHFSARMRGRWFAIGPGDLQMTASGVPLTIRDFLATGVFSADGKLIELAYLTGVLNVQQLSDAVGMDLRICELDETKDACDEEGNVLLAGVLTGGENPLPFTCFIPTPLNKATTIPASTAFDVYCTGEIDQATLVAELRSCTATDATPPKEDALPQWECYKETGALVAGAATIDPDNPRHLTYAPSAPLAAGTWYRFGVTAATSGGGGGSDVRHVVFRVAP